MGLGVKTGEITAVPLLRRDKLVVLAALGAVIALTWTYLEIHSIHMSAEATGHAAVAMAANPWTAADFAFRSLDVT